jgi:polar amino acid transport system permease protein
VKFKPLQWLVQAFILAIRGTPLMLQLIAIYYGLAFMGYILPVMTAATICFAMHYGVYNSEVFRGAIQGVSQNQREAAKTLSLNRFQCFVYIILPQATKKALPSWGNEWHSLAKGTSIASVIGIAEVTRAAKNLVSYSALMYPLFLTALFYLALSLAITALFWGLERRLSYYA